MNEFNLSRRHFFKLSGVAVAASLTSCDTGSAPKKELDIVLNDDLVAGHRVYGELPDFGGEPVEEFEVLVVGGGIAGLAAAASLPGRDVLVCELGEGLGGSAGYGEYAGLQFGQGAHYELEYPSYYGADALALLERLQVIRFDSARDTWAFVDEHYLIDPVRQERTFTGGIHRKSTLPDDEETRAFEKLLAPYGGRMPQPLRLMDESLWPLANQSFLDFILQSGLRPSPTFLQAVDYQMKDDYGENAAGVSAIAGIHYYQCRPYLEREVKILSPPQGNGYFVQKLASSLASEQVRTRHLVTRLQTDGAGITADVLDLENGTPKRIRARQVIYAGHKQGLKYILPQAYQSFEGVPSAPWIVVNVVLKNAEMSDSYWQNEVIGKDDRFLGFVNSAAQQEEVQGYAVLTGYYCLPAGQRQFVLDLQGQLRTWVDATIETMEAALEKPVRDQVEKVFVKLHGHGMPIPIPGYLRPEPITRGKIPNLHFAGCDTGRLPLCFEAIDSGILAARIES